MFMLSIHSLFYNTPAIILCIILVAMMLLMFRFGIYFRRKHIKKHPEFDGLGPIEGAMLGLLALLLAFTFGMAGEKYDSRREVVIEEANNIGTAILCADLYPDSVRSEFREYFKQYVETRVAYFEAGTNQREIDSTLQSTAFYSDKLWTLAAKHAGETDGFARTIRMTTELNSMIDIVTTRDAGNKATIPESIWILLFLLTLAASFISAYGSKTDRTDRILLAGFVTMTAMTILIIIDLDRPRRGLITIGIANEKIVELREMFTEH